MHTYQPFSNSLFTNECAYTFILELAHVLLPTAKVVLFMLLPTAGLLILRGQLWPGIVELFEHHASVVILKSRPALDLCPAIRVC